MVRAAIFTDLLTIRCHLSDTPSRTETEGFPMANADRQMPGHVEVAYQDAVNNITFLRRQQWIATNYALLVYAALFVVSAEYFSRTDFARNWLGIFAIVTFLVHLYMVC